MVPAGIGKPGKIGKTGENLIILENSGNFAQNTGKNKEFNSQSWGNEIVYWLFVHNIF